MKQSLIQTLSSDFTIPYRDNIWGHVYVTPAMAELFRSAPFNRLHHIRQLGPTYLVYPGATHSRAAHSIGVYHLAKKLLLQLLERGAEQWVSSQGAFSFLCAALLHDIGHFPYTHSLKDLPLEDHEVLTARMILSEKLKFLVGRTGADPYMAAAIVDHNLPSDNNTEIQFYRHLLSGVLDPDKLDYLNRDAYHCGVPYGTQDIDFTFSRLYPDKERGISVDTKGIANVEAILFSKYLMYRSVYWHREVRSATTMMKKVFRWGLMSGEIVPENLYNLDDCSLFSLLNTLSGEYSVLAQQVQQGLLWQAIIEIPLDIGKYRQIISWETRDSMESKLAELLTKALKFTVSVKNIIIDIPEPISFETDLSLFDEKGSFLSGPTVFTAETMNSFSCILRIIRVFVDPVVFGRIKESSQAQETLRNPDNWLHL